MNTEQLFDNWALRGKAEGMEREHHPRALQALEQLPLLPDQRVLDLGCGNGWATRWLADATAPGGRAVGVDLSAEMLARARAADDSGRTSFVRAPFDGLPEPDRSFDAAFSMEAIYYAKPLEAALKEIARVLRPGGFVMLCMDFFQENPHCHDWPEIVGVFMDLRSEDEWSAALAGAGFDVRRTFRCLDPRPVSPDLSAEERGAREHFRREVGSLALLAERR